ncbi:MAG: multicopper oxidase family protein [Burkholderiales bacterium]|nr:multicopper oxidase family protein [Burkholderiales bacterium]
MGPLLNRRGVLGACAAPLLSALPGVGRAQAGERALRAVEAHRQFPGLPVPTPMWCFDEATPGPLLRYRKGDRVAVRVRNDLKQPTTVHWHGVRVPIAMDGVPGISQPAIKPGESFLYQFDARDSGTFWYHPHQKSFEQVGRGMYGAFIVEEARPIEANADVCWVLSDLLVDRATGAQAPFGRIHEHATRGRIGNIVTVNGRPAGREVTLDVRSGQRVRLRLVNAATARAFLLSFEGHDPHVIAFDGQGVTPHRAGKEGVLLGPGMRVDLVLDCADAPGKSFAVSDAGSRAVIAAVRYRDEAPLAANLFKAPLQLAPNDLVPPDMKNAQRHEVAIRGGDAGPPVIGLVDGKEIPLHEMMRTHGLAWTVNTHATHEEAHEHVPLFTFKRGTTHIITMQNGTAFIHPMHLHGHFFRVLAYNGQAPRHDEWRDTVFLNSWDEVTVAVVADEPGDWMFHCHVLEHAAAGMMGVIRVE